MITLDNELQLLEHTGVTCLNCEYHPCSYNRTMPLCTGYTPKMNYKILPEREFSSYHIGMLKPVTYKAIPVQYDNIEFHILHNNGYIGKCNLPNMPVYIALKFNKRNGVTVKITGYDSILSCIHAFIKRYEDSKQ